MKTEWQYTKTKNKRRFHIEVSVEPAIGIGVAMGVVRKDFIINIFLVVVQIFIEIR